MDQTSYPTNGELRGKKILVIGSGDDIDGRKMQGLVDGGAYDIIARVNKHYGSREDVGNRTDYVFTRWQQWLANEDWFTKEQLGDAKEIVVLNQFTALKKFDGFSQTEYRWLCMQVGHQQVSAGIQALAYFLNRGVATVDVIGYGCTNGKFKKTKEYTTGSQGTTPAHNMQGNVDVNTNYDWHKEKTWAVNQARVNFL